MPLSRKKVLVTGGAGFLGSHLIDRLLAEGDEVICADNLSTGQMRNLAHLTDEPRFQFLNHDVRRPLSIEIDEIYNLACPASPAQYQRDPVGTARTSVLGAIHMLDLAEAAGATILQASTSEVYGDPDRHPQAETYWGRVNPIGPRACYDEGKRCAEAMVFDHHRQYGVKVKVARIFNTYGPRMREDDGRVVSNFVTQALAKGPITIYGDGAQTRSFCYVDDMVEGLIRLMATGPDVMGPINLGGPDEITIKALAERVRALSGAQAPLRHAPAPEDDPKARRPDITRAEALLGWTPRWSLDYGLTRVIAYFRGHDGTHMQSTGD